MNNLRHARHHLRGLARDVAVAQLARTWRHTGKTHMGLTRKQVHFVYLHTVPPQEEADFRSLLTQLSKFFTFVGHSEALAKLTKETIDRPYLSLSFDDGFASNYRTAGILEEFGTTGMFYVPTAFIGTQTVTAARKIFGYDRYIDEPALTWDQIDNLIARGHEIGSHTVNHLMLSQISGGPLRDQIFQSFETILARTGRTPHFAWPFGRFTHFSEEAAFMVRAAGYASCASAERGSHVIKPDQFSDLCLRRDHVMSSWPIDQSLFFIARSALRAEAKSNRYPEDWHIEVV